jgi:hypothetical protein
MAAFLKLDLSTNPDSLKAASGTDYEYAVNQALSAFAATDTGVGTLSVNPGSTAGLTSIGTFTDTYYPYDQNQHPVGTTITSTVYTFYQDRQTASEAALRRPVEFSGGAIQEQTDTALNADLISTALANLVSLGVGSYVLQPTAPVGGTWVAKSTITNNLDVNESNVTYLWRKTAAASTPTTVLPIKANSTSPISLKEMIASEVQTLTARIRNRIVATGIGTYAIQATAPVSGGTWTTAGSQFFDTTRTQSLIAYNGTYAGSYIRSFSGTYTSTYTGLYSGLYSGTYGGSYSAFYAGSYAGNYVGTISIGFTGSYTGRTKYAGFARAGSPAVAYAGTYFSNYNRTYTGLYSGSYSGAYLGFYPNTYGGSYGGNYNQGFVGTYNATFTGSYTGSYTGNTLNNDSSNVSNVYLWIRTA